MTSVGSAGIPDQGALVAAFAPFKGQVVGLLITYVHAPTIADGTARADQVNSILKSSLPSLFPASAILKPLGWQDLDPAATGQTLFNVFLISNHCR